MKIFFNLSLLLLFCWGTTVAQSADPSIGGANFASNTIKTGETTTLDFNFVNTGFTEIPANSIELTIVMANTYYTTDGSTTPTGPGSAFFDWAYLGSDVWRGTNKVVIDAFGGGDISLTVTGIQQSTGFETTNINVQPVANFAAFANESSNDNQQPALKIEQGTGPAPCASVGGVGAACTDGYGNPSTIGSDCNCIDLGPCYAEGGVGAACTDVNGKPSTIDANCNCIEVVPTCTVGDACVDADGDASVLGSDCNCIEVDNGIGTDADPAVTGANFVPNEIEEGAKSTLTISFVNSGSTAIPANSIDLTISSANTFYSTDGTTAPTGIGGALFSWNYLGSDTWRGRNIGIISAFGGGDITLEVMGLKESSGFETTNINVQPVNQFGAFNNVSSNDNLQPGLKVVPVACAGITGSATNVVAEECTTFGSATLVGNGGTAPYTFSGDLTAGANGSVSNLSAGSYSIVATDAEGCSSAPFNLVIVNDCGCTDKDKDGVCAQDDCDDNNPNVKYGPGDACDDGNACTENDTYDANCNCVGTPNTTEPALVGVPADETVACDAIPSPANVTSGSLAVGFAEVRSGDDDCNYKLTRTWRAMDDCGNSVITTQMITIIDDEAPVLSGVPGDITINVNNGDVNPPVNVTATDNCDPNPTVNFATPSILPDPCSNQITFPEIWSAMDACGNTSASQTRMVTIINDDFFQDEDGDGVCDNEDICPGFDDAIDSDGDGTPDGCEQCDGSLTIVRKELRDVACYGGNDGRLVIEIQGGDGPYTTSWSNGPTSLFNSNLTAGTYTVTVRDVNNCAKTATYTIAEPTELVVTLVSITPENCDANTGAIDIEVSGGTAPYSYNWIAYANTQDLSGLSARDYILEVTDANGCKSGRMTYTVPKDCGCDNVTYGGKIGFGSNCNYVPTICAGDANPLIGSCALPSGGSGTLQYVWLMSTTCPNRPPGSINNDPDWSVIPNSNTPTLQLAGLTETTCFIRCARRSGCEDYIGESNIVKVRVDGNPQTWYADKDNDGFGDPNDTRLACSQPSGFVGNDEDCDDDNASIPAAVGSACDDGDATTENDKIQADRCTCEGEPIAPTCPTVEITTSDGKVTISGLTAPRNFVGIFKSPQNQQVNSCANCDETVMFNLPAGNYRALIQFKAQDYSNIPNCGNVIRSFTITTACVDKDKDGVCADEDCDDDNPNVGEKLPAGTTCDDGDPSTGNDQITADGCGCAGTPIPCYALGGDYDGDGVCADNDCDDTNPNIGAKKPVGSACDDGDASTGNDVIQADGCGCAGTPIPCYALGGDYDGDGVCADNDCDDTNPNIGAKKPVGSSCDDGNDDTADDKILSDGCSCQGTPIQTCDLMVEVLNVTNPTCEGRNDGVVAITATNGVGPYQYNWSNGKTGTNGIAGLVAGDYTVSITDANGCSLVKTYSLVNPDPIMAVETIVDATCGEANGAISLIVSGGVGGYKYFWNNVESTRDQTNLAAGTYTLRIRDRNYCESEFTYTVGNIVTDACDPGDDTVVECGKATITYGSGKLTINVDPSDKNYRFRVQALPTYAVLNDKSCDYGCGAMHMVNLDEGDYLIRVYENNEWRTPFCETIITMGDAPSCTDNDGDGVCAPDDCDDNNPNIRGKQTPGTSCDDGNPNTGNDQITADGCGCAGTPIIIDPCAAKGGDRDGDGVCAADDCDDNDANVPAAQGTACDDGDATTENDQILADGCSCAGTPIIVDPCLAKGGDADGDGICAADDCDDNNANYPKPVGSRCDDGDANTENDRIQSNGCDCAGTPIQTGEPDCEKVTAVAGDGTITVSGLTSPIEHVKVYLLGQNNSLTQKASCVGDCGDTWVAEDLAPGDYLIHITLRDRNWGSLCANGAQDLPLYVTVEGGATASSRNSENNEGALSINPTQLKVYPNPARDEAFIDLVDWTNQSVDLVIHNHFSQVVFEQHIEQVSSSPTRLDLRSFTNGLYYIQVKTKGQRPVTRKLMVTRLY